MGKQLSQAPVCFTVAQLSFNPVLAIDGFLASIQDAFRSAGFPDYSRISTQVMEVATSPEGDLSTHQRRRDSHVFRNRERTAALLLDVDRLTYELTDYPVFDAFSATFLNAVEIVNRHRAIEYSERLGMRMLDAVQPLAGETIEQYLVPQALGFGDLLTPGIEHEQTLIESIFRTSAKSLLVRAVRLREGLGLPPDLMPLRLKLADRFVAHRSETVVLDCDSSRDGRRDYLPAAIAAELVELKSALSQTFKTLVTPYALATWS